MPLLAILVKAGLSSLYLLYVAVTTIRYGVLLSVMTFMAAVYIACVVAWSLYIVPLIAALFSTGFGFVLGLAFPPIASTVLFGYVGLYGCVVAKNYLINIVKVGAK